MTLCMPDGRTNCYCEVPRWISLRISIVKPSFQMFTMPGIRLTLGACAKAEDQHEGDNTN